MFQVLKIKVILMLSAVCIIFSVEYVIEWDGQSDGGDLLRPLTLFNSDVTTSCPRVEVVVVVRRENTQISKTVWQRARELLWGLLTSYNQPNTTCTVISTLSQHFIHNMSQHFGINQLLIKHMKESTGWAENSWNWFPRLLKHRLLIWGQMIWVTRWRTSVNLCCSYSTSVYTSSSYLHDCPEIQTH